MHADTCITSVIIHRINSVIKFMFVDKIIFIVDLLH